MSFKVRFVAERRLSLKTITNRARRYLPVSFYSWLLTLRYLFFKRRCNNIALPQLSYSDGSWVNRKTTADLKRITKFLEAEKAPFSIFQIGVGNSSLYENIREKTSRFAGITIVEDELQLTKEKFSRDFGSTYDVRIMNKYSNEITEFDTGFDYIIDNDLSSYACCLHHFHIMLDCYRDLLSSEGAILIGIDGLRYFDSGFGLTLNNIKRIAKKHGLYFYPGSEFHMLKKHPITHKTQSSSDT